MPTSPLRQTPRAHRALALLAVIAMLVSGCATRFGGESRDSLRWAAPSLRSPEVIDVAPAGGTHRLDVDTDYLVRLPSEPVRGPLRIEGGRNVVIVGGEIRTTSAAKAALTIRDWAGTFHLEGVAIDPGGARGLRQSGIHVNSTRVGAVAQLQRIHVAEVAGGSVLQGWAGPSSLRIDELTGLTDDRGILLSPREYYSGSLERFEYHHVDLHRTARSSNSLYVQTAIGGEAPEPIVGDSFADPGPDGSCAPKAPIDAAFQRAGVRCGAPDGGMYVRPWDVGLGYEAASTPPKAENKPRPVPTTDTPRTPPTTPPTTEAPTTAPPTTAPPATTPPPPPPAPTGARLRWTPPGLSNPTDVAVPVAGGTLNLDASRDYRLVFPSSPVTGGLRVNGGRNIVAIGGELRIERSSRAAMWFNNFAGTLHLEGLRVDPGGSRGIDQDAIRIISTVPGSVAQLQNIWVDQVHGAYDIEHGDILQTWAGPTELRVDRMTGFTDYQGFFMAPSHFGPDRFPLNPPKLSNIDLHMVKAKGWVLFAISDQGVSGNETSPPVPRFDEVYADPGTVSSYPYVAGNGPILAANPGVQRWTTAVGHMVDRDGVGIGYQRPGD